MKKHSFSVILLAASLLSAGFVTSCKDNDSDLFTDLDRQQATLKEALQDQIDALGQKIDNLKSCECVMTNVWEEALKDGSFDAAFKDAYNSYYSNVVATKTEVSEALDKATEAYNKATDLLPLIQANADSIVSLQAQVIAANALIETAQSTADDALLYAKNAFNLADSVLNLVQENQTKIQTTRDSLTILDTKIDVMNEEVKQAVDSAAKAYAKAVAVESKYQALSDKIDTLSDALIDSCAVLRQLTNDQFKKAVATAESYAYGLYVSLDNRLVDVEHQVALNKIDIATLKGDVSTLKQDIKDLTDRVNAISDSVKALDAKIDTVKNDLANLITGVLIQGTKDPIFGYFALPFGVQTNILAGLYGDVLTAQPEFPTSRTTNYVNAADALTALEIATAGIKVSELEAADTIYAGKVYVTINPTNIDFTDQELTLETSAGNASVIRLKGLKKSTEELTFGYTRAANNGFYEAEAYILPANASQAKPNVDLASLKTVASDLLNNHSFSISSAVQAVYSNVNGILPRYALKAGWKNMAGEELAVYSHYDLAATALKPLSYNFLAGKTLNFGYSIPTIDEDLISKAFKEAGISDIKIELDFDSIKIDVPDFNLHIDWKGVSFDDQQQSIEVKYEYKIPQYDVLDNQDGTYGMVVKTDANNDTIFDEFTGVAYGDVASIYASMSDSINSAINSMVDQVNDLGLKLDDFTASVSGLEEQINSMLNNLQGSLNTQIQDILDNIQDNIESTFGGYITSANSYITKINSVISRLSSFISNPNSKLQPVLIYTTTNGTSAIVSASQANPTQLKLSGSGDQACELIATSYTADLLVPAYKRHVAVVNVINGDKSAQGGDATCKAALTKANDAETFNEVIDGSQRGVAFTTSADYAGYTYEIAYSAIDYSGKIVTRRFYVQVVK